MQVFLRELNYKSNILDLKRRGFNNFIFCQIANNRGFIVGEPMMILRLQECNSFVAVVSENEKIPLYKQDMNFRMGKGWKSTQSVTHRYTAHILNECKDNWSYKVWQII